VLFVNAGVAKFAPLPETSEDLYDEQFDINVKGAYFTIQKALPFLNDGASIILNTSVAGQKGGAGATAYSATKAALRSLARTVAAELVGRGIRVNTVAPGPIVTPIFGRTGLPKEAFDELAKELLARVPMNLPLDAPLPAQCAGGMPLVEAIEQRAASQGLAVDSRIIRGRSYRDGLRRLLDTEQFDRVIVSAGNGNGGGLSNDDLEWLLDRVPAEILILRPARDDERRITAEAVRGHF